MQFFDAQNQCRNKSTNEVIFQQENYTIIVGDLLYQGIYALAHFLLHRIYGTILTRRGVHILKGEKIWLYLTI